MSSAAPSSESLTYDAAKWPLYGLAWCSRSAGPPRLAIGSFIEEYSNKVQVVQQNDNELKLLGTFDHPYPTTKIGWIPDPGSAHPDLIGTTGDFLRLWDAGADGPPKLKCLLNNVRVNRIAYPFHALSVTPRRVLRALSNVFDYAHVALTRRTSLASFALRLRRLIGMRKTQALSARLPSIQRARYGMWRRSRQRHSSLRMTKRCTTLHFVRAVSMSSRPSALTARSASLTFAH